MNRRIAFCVAVIGFNLMACCCGGVGPAKGPKPPAVAAQQKTDAVPKTGEANGKAEKPEVDAEQAIRDKYATDLARRPYKAEIKAVVSNPAQSKKLKSEVNGVTVEVVSVKVEPLSYIQRSGGKKATGEMLVVRLKITNGSTRQIFYAPWHTTGTDGPELSDNRGQSIAAWRSGKNGFAWPAGGFEEVAAIQVGKSATDFVAFDKPSIEAELFSMTLPARNVQQKSDKPLTFEFPRLMFESADDRAVAIAAENAKRLAAEEKRLKGIEDTRIDAIEKAMGKEIAAHRKVIADAEAARVRQAAEDEAARIAAIEAKLPKVTRANYNKLKENMTLDAVQDILGPGRENAASGGLQVVSWESGAFPIVVITCTFQNGYLKSRSIID
jgi:hypothetical protein